MKYYLNTREKIKYEKKSKKLIRDITFHITFKYYIYKSIYKSFG